MTTLNQRDLIDIVRRNRARQSRNRKFGEAVADVIGSVIANAIHALFQGWMLMLAVAVVHDHWLPRVPGVGYWWAVVLVALLRGTFSAAHAKVGDR